MTEKQAKQILRAAARAGMPASVQTVGGRESGEWEVEIGRRGYRFTRREPATRLIRDGVITITGRPGETYDVKVYR
ncbi:MAG: hypothetical protein OCU12_07165 [Methanophagales archaeon]|nr:hypothetical protein [Methanophagales archaeon]